MACSMGSGVAARQKRVQSGDSTVLGSILLSLALVGSITQRKVSVKDVRLGAFERDLF